MFIQIANAANNSFETGVQKITHKFVEVIFTPIIWLLVGASLVSFVYGLAIFILNSSDIGSDKQQGGKSKGKNHMIWGVVGLFIVFSVWGIIGLIGGTIQSIAK